MKIHFNRYLALLAAAVFLCVALPLGALAGIERAEASPNVLTNGDFEQGADGWTLGNDTTVSDDAHGGMQAMCMRHNLPWGEALTRDVAVEANTDYILTFWTKRVSGSAAWDVFIYNKNTMTVLPLSEGNNWISPTQQWTQSTVVFHSSAATTLFLKFCPESTMSGDVLLDDVVLRRKEDIPDIPDTPDQPVVPAGLQNGDFEQGADGWSLNGTTAVSADAHGGSQAMKLGHDSPWGEALTQVVAVEKNTDYVLSFWTKRLTGTAAWDLFIYDYSIMSVLPLTVGNNWFASAEDWVQVTVEFHSASAANLFLKFCPEAVTSGEILLDDVLLYKKGTSPDLPDVPDTPDTPDTPDQPVVPAGLQNGDFEQGADGWTLGGNAAISSDAHSGTQAVLLSNPTVWGETLTQVVAVEKNTDYVLSFWTKRLSGTVAWDLFIYDSDTMTVLPLTVGANWFASAEDWAQVTVEFHSASAANLFLKFCPESVSSGEILIDDVVLQKKGDEPILPPDPPTPPTPPAQPLVLDSFGVDNNRPRDEENNLIIHSGFESADGAQWNVDTFIGDSLTVVEDATTRDGAHSLFFNTSGLAEAQAIRRVFWMDIEPNTDYVFSTWLKGAYLSADNVARATVGVIDPDTETYLVYRGEKSSTKQRQLLPPAWDNEWHIRSVSFNSGEKTRIGIAVDGYGSQLWLDGMALYQKDHGVKYIGANLLESVSIDYSLQGTSCKAEDSLTQNIHMEDGTTYWQSGTGWRNGFLSVQESQYEYGASLKYTASADADGVHYIKWIPVKPDTDYVFSADVKILADGAGKLVLLDGKKRDTLAFMEVDFDSLYYGEEWFEAAVGFNTGLFDVIGIAIVDAGGEALIDNVRLFEEADTAAVEDAYIAPPAPPVVPEEPSDEIPDENPGETDQEETIDPPAEEDTQPEKVKKPIKKYRPVAGTTQWWLWIGIGGGVLLAGAAVVLILLLKRRKKVPTAE